MKLFNVPTRAQALPYLKDASGILVALFIIPGAVTLDKTNWHRLSFSLISLIVGMAVYNIRSAVDGERLR
jgi:hypothetical protein